VLPITDFLKLQETLPAVDVRSEGEYSLGQIPGSFNIPILNNEERIAVGTDYKRKGQLEAIKTGFRLVGPRIINIVNDAEKIAAGKELLVYCWRGGMRSTNFCQFLSMAKIKTHQLQGGYKAYRNYSAEILRQPFQFYVIGGFTGSGKTEVLTALERNGEQIINLEKIANHKGSVFGGLMMPPQPTTEQFQNNLIEQILKLDVNKPIWIEDESITIGKVVLPSEFWHRVTTSPLVALDVSKEVRVQRLVKEYGPANRDEFSKAMAAIVKKLGGQHYQSAREKLLSGDLASAIEILLVYYDKVYGSGLEKRRNKIKLTASWDGASADELATSLISQIL
jgi:tRNA 2-selenouridine synthase